ncbi:hypothetical protein TSUD_160290 [Trifolium subterraneum]|uniref:Transposase-associated domain-containing protein n=1 Tax=Trifolium subterraneum TaxID=3900 RepID=A0A2Z6MXI2_TRISU|nr:hypothetical protein TSUD_160290 [Trifolium subterraneum]
MVRGRQVLARTRQRASKPLTCLAMARAGERSQILRREDLLYLLRRSTRHLLLVFRAQDEPKLLQPAHQAQGEPKPLPTRAEVDCHLHRWGFEPSYENWEYHGESSSDSSDDSDSMDIEDDIGNGVDHEMSDDPQIFNMLYEMHRSTNANREEVFEDPMPSNINEEPNKKAKRFYGLVKDAEQQLYPGCKNFSKLSFIIRLFQMKYLYGWSNTSLDSLLKLLIEAFPEGNVLPDSMYEVKKIIKDLGLDYVKIDACANDCILYRGKDYENLNECPICGKSRWQENMKKNDVPDKIVRYFPIKPRLQRLFMSKQIAEDMTWHKNKRINDGVLRHPADSLTWKRFDEQHKFFSTDAHNTKVEEARLELAAVEYVDSGDKDMLANIAFKSVVGERSGYSRGL